MFLMAGNAPFLLPWLYCWFLPQRHSAQSLGNGSKTKGIISAVAELSSATPSFCVDGLTLIIAVLGEKGFKEVIQLQ